jgi:DNA-binding HxlR family transcriptional regulator
MDDCERFREFCPTFHHAVEVIGGRWTGAIIRAMLGGAGRFSDLRQTVPGLSDRMLSERLKVLEAEGIVERSVMPTTPVRVEYRLTDKGRGLSDVFEAISAWAGVWAGPAEAPEAGSEQQREGAEVR